MNEERLLQTAIEIGKEYSNKLNQMVEGYEYLSGKEIKADDMDFWGQKEVEKVETLASLWWWVHKMGDPFFYDDSFIEENDNETY